MTHPFTGTGVALITPFNEDKTIDFNALEKLVEDQVANGTDYLVVLGTTAETPTLAVEEQKEVTQCVLSANAGRLPVVLGMGGNDPARIVKSISETDFSGISGILSVTPYYNRPAQEGLFLHYREIVNASPVPIILYNVPSRTGVNMDADTSLRVARLSEKVAGIKDASGESSQCARMVKYAPDYFKVISGDDVLALPLIAIGGVGVISVIANALPAQMSKLVKLANSNRYAEARESHLQLLDLFKLLFREGNPAGVKALMEIMGKARSVVRLPLVPASKTLYTDIEAELKNIL